MSRILVVEDDEDVRDMVIFRLKQGGHHTRGVGSAQEALAAVAERGVPDAVVLDVGLPDISGLDLLTRLRECPGAASLPVIFLSGRVTEQDIAAGRALGATYLTKPFVASALLRAIEQGVAGTQGDDW